MLDSLPMQSGWFYVALFLVMGVIGPVFWTVTLTVLLWLGRRYLSDHVGRRLFGHYWKAKVRRQHGLHRGGDRGSA